MGMYLKCSGKEKTNIYRLTLRAERSGDRIPVGARFFAPVQTGPGAHPASCTMGTGSFPGVKRSGRGADYPPPPSDEVENESSYISTPPLGPWWPVIGWPLPFTFIMRWLDKTHWNPAVTLRFARISEQRANLFLHINWWSEPHGIVLTYWFVQPTGRVYCAVRNESLYKTNYVSLLQG
jgi:hypothetical protein